MKTTLIIPDPVFRDLKRQATERGITMSELATEVLRKGLAARPKPKRPFRFRTFKMGPARVNVADRGALYDFLDAQPDAPLHAKLLRKG